MVRLWIRAASLAATLCAVSALRVSGEDRFYVHDSVPFGQWNNGWWGTGDLCPPLGAEPMLCYFPDSPCGGISLPSTSYAFVQLADSCHAVVYPAGIWTFDLYISGPLGAAVTAALVSADCDSLCGALEEHAAGSAPVAPGDCVQVTFTAAAPEIAVGGMRRLGLRISHDATPFSVRLCWGASCQSGFWAPAGGGCSTSVRPATWGRVKARFD